MIAETMKAAAEAAKKLKLSVLELVPGFLALAKGEGIMKAITQTIKWGVFAAAIPVVTLLGAAMIGVSTAIRKIVIETGSLDAALRKLAEVKAAEKMFAPLLKGVDAARDRVAELIQFVATAPFDFKGAAEASHSLQLLSEGVLATQAGLRLVGDAAAATGNPIQDVAGEVGMLYNELKKGEDISGTANALKSIGVISEQTARQVVQLQESGAGFSTIWAKVDADLNKSSGGMDAVKEEVGALQGRLEKARENLAAAFGKPFIDSEKTGIKNTIKTMENLRPVLAHVGEALSTVSGTVSNVKSSFLSWITSIPRLGEVLGNVTQIAVNMGAALALIGAGVFANRLKNVGGFLNSIGNVLGSFRSTDLPIIGSIKAIGDRSLESAAKAKTLQVILANTAAQELAAGNKGMAFKEATAGAKAAGRTATGYTLRAAATGDVAAAGSLATQGIGALGRALLSPWFVIPAVIATAAAAFQSLYRTHQANKQALKELNASNHEVLHGLDEQIASITTLDDKYRALAATTNALIQARSKLASLKLPSEDNQLTTWQKIANFITQSHKLGTAGFFLGGEAQGLGIPKEKTKASQERNVVRGQIEELESRQTFTANISDQTLASEAQLEREKRRAVFEREKKSAEAQAALATAPDAATRQAIHEEERSRFSEFAQTGKAQEAIFQETEFKKEPSRNLERQAQAAVEDATQGLIALGANSTEVGKSNTEEAKKILAKQNRPENIGKTREELAAEADDARLGELKARSDKASLNATDIRGNIPDISEEEKKSIPLLEARLAKEKEITAEKKAQADISLASASELQNITAALAELQKPGVKQITLKSTGETFDNTVENRTKLAQREGQIRDSISKKEAYETRAQEEANAALQESIAKRNEAINIEAERKILQVRTEGLDREEEMAGIRRTQIEEEIDSIKQAQAEFEKLHPQAPKTAPEDIPAVVEKRLEEKQIIRRQTIQIPREREDIQFQTKAIAIEATKGRGPAAEILALQKQLALNKEITAVIKERAASKIAPLDKDEAARQLTQQAALRNEIRKALEDAVFAQNQINEAARSETEQLRLSLTGQERLAELEGIRLKYAQAITQAVREGNMALAEQLSIQGKQAIAGNLAHQLSPDYGESSSDFSKRINDQKLRAQHEEHQQRIAQGAIDDAADRERRMQGSMGGHLDESSDVTKALRAQQSLAAAKAQAEEGRRQSAAAEADIMREVEASQTFSHKQILEHPGVKSAAEASVLEHETATRSASEAAVKHEEGKGQITPAQQHELKVAAAPFKEALDSSNVLQAILSTLQGCCPGGPKGPGGGQQGAGGQQPAAATGSTAAQQPGQQPSRQPVQMPKRTEQLGGKAAQPKAGETAEAYANRIIQNEPRGTSNDQVTADWKEARDYAAKSVAALKEKATFQPGSKSASSSVTDPVIKACISLAERVKAQRDRENPPPISMEEMKKKTGLSEEELLAHRPMPGTKNLNMPSIFEAQQPGFHKMMQDWSEQYAGDMSKGNEQLQKGVKGARTWWNWMTPRQRFEADMADQKKSPFTSGNALDFMTKRGSKSDKEALQKHYNQPLSQEWKDGQWVTDTSRSLGAPTGVDIHENTIGGKTIIGEHVAGFSRLTAANELTRPSAHEEPLGAQIRDLHEKAEREGKTDVHGNIADPEMLKQKAALEKKLWSPENRKLQAENFQNGTGEMTDVTHRLLPTTPGEDPHLDPVYAAKVFRDAAEKHPTKKVHNPNGIGTYQKPTLEIAKAYEDYASKLDPSQYVIAKNFDPSPTGMRPDQLVSLGNEIPQYAPWQNPLFGLNKAELADRDLHLRSEGVAPSAQEGKGFHPEFGAPDYLQRPQEPPVAAPTPAEPTPAQPAPQAGAGDSSALLKEMTEIKGHLGELVKKVSVV